MRTKLKQTEICHLVEERFNNKNLSANELNKWWHNTSFDEMEVIAGLRRYQYDPQDGYQEFVDACHDFWSNLSKNEKTEIWQKFN